MSASNEFIAMKIIIAMKIHRNEMGKFIALMLLTIFQRILAFFEENPKNSKKQAKIENAMNFPFSLQEFFSLR